MLKKTFIALAVSGATMSGTAIAEANLPDMFTAPAAQSENIKREITEAERKALDAAILNATADNLPVGNEVLKTGKMPVVDQQGRLTQIAQNFEDKNGAAITSTPAVSQSKGVEVAEGDEISPYPKFNSAVNTTPPAQTVNQALESQNMLLDKAMEIYTPEVKLTLAPGEPTSITVGLAQPNKISFNFEELDVRTTNTTMPLIIEGGDLYVTPTSLDEPVGILVGESGVPESQVNILLLPAPVPQIIGEVHVKMSAQMRNKRKAIHEKAEKERLAAEAELKEVEKALERGDSKLHKGNDPYVSRIVDLLVEVAKEDIPKGFSLNLNVAEADKYPCDTSKLIVHHETVMQLESNKEIIDIVKVTNDINGYRSIEDEYCIKPGVLAAATYKKSHLAPGESTEVYVLRDKNFKQKFLQEQSRKRPSVSH
ncbi:hypothetical protein DC915_RS02735 [Vibrio parahaemolyticus]|nr:hypothetical protein [Vibrio parahaemolyticus]EJG0009894.1 hypothetical protein [Vibrio parahaemolyticus]